MTEVNSRRLVRIMSEIFNTEEEKINPDFSIDTVEAWTSLSHLNLVVALESEFDVSFTDSETVEILSFDLIKAVLRDHGIQI
jgi:acyl carrier protein